MREARVRWSFESPAAVMRELGNAWRRQNGSPAVVAGARKDSLPLPAESPPRRPVLSADHGPFI